MGKDIAGTESQNAAESFDKAAEGSDRPKKVMTSAEFYSFYKRYEMMEIAASELYYMCRRT